MVKLDISMTRGETKMTDDIDISEELLEAIVRHEKISPENLNPKHAVDRFILEFCDWDE